MWIEWHSFRTASSSPKISSDFGWFEMYLIAREGEGARTSATETWGDQMFPVVAPSVAIARATHLENRVHVVISAFCALAYTAFACASAPPDAMTNDGAAS